MHSVINSHTTQWYKQDRNYYSHFEEEQMRMAYHEKRCGFTEYSLVLDLAADITSVCPERKIS